MIIKHKGNVAKFFSIHFSLDSPPFHIPRFQTVTVLLNKL